MTDIVGKSLKALDDKELLEFYGASDNPDPQSLSLTLDISISGLISALSTSLATHIFCNS